MQETKENKANDPCNKTKFNQISLFHLLYLNKNSRLTSYHQKNMALCLKASKF